SLKLLRHKLEQLLLHLLPLQILQPLSWQLLPLKLLVLHLLPPHVQVKKELYVFPDNVPKCLLLWEAKRMGMCNSIPVFSL
ncbi:hypothetical protein HID58_028281, partial [Brassica napus]